MEAEFLCELLLLWQALNWQPGFTRCGHSKIIIKEFFWVFFHFIVTFQFLNLLISPLGSSFFLSTPPFFFYLYSSQSGEALWAPFSKFCIFLSYQSIFPPSQLVTFPRSLEGCKSNMILLKGGLLMAWTWLKRNTPAHTDIHKLIHSVVNTCPVNWDSECFIRTQGCTVQVSAVCMWGQES